MERGRTEVETDRTNDLAVESDPVVAKGESRKGDEYAAQAAREATQTAKEMHIRVYGVFRSNLG